MNGFEVGKFIVISVHTNAEEQASISPVDNFVVPELALRLAFMPGLDQGSTPRQNWIGTSGLVGRLYDALPHAAEPTVEG